MKKQIENIKRHFAENKRAYYAGTVGLVVGGIAVYFADSSTDQKAKQVVVAMKTGDVSQNIVQVNLPRRGHPGNLVVCDQTGIAFSSQNQAAKLMGLSKGNVSKHLNGLTDQVNGYTFSNLGEAQV